MEKLYRRPERVIMTGTPVRSGFSAKSKAELRHELGMSEGPVVVSFWGSLGAARMNDIMAGFIARNAEEKAFYHVHATGGGSEGVDRMMQKLRERGIIELPAGLDLRPYIDNMRLRSRPVQSRSIDAWRTCINWQTSRLGPVSERHG